MPPTLLGAKNEYRKYRIKEKYELLVAFTIRGYFLYPKKRVYSELDYYQINRHKKEKRSNRFSFFIRCSENGHFLDTLLFLLKFSKSFTFLVH